MDPVTASLMSIGSGSAAGLRPYLTIFLLGLAGLLIPVDTPYIGDTVALIPHTLANPWVLVICGILALGDGGLDKVLGLNLPLEPLNQVLRPIFGALVGMQLGWDTGTAGVIASTLLGLGSATTVSVGKGSLTAGMTAIFPEPVSQFIRSVVEDFGAIALVFLAVIAPIIAAIFGIVIALIGVWLFFKLRKAYLALRDKSRAAREARKNRATAAI